MAWWKYQPLKEHPQTRYDATIRGWPAVIIGAGAILFVVGYAWEEEEGRSVLTVAGMVVVIAGVAMVTHPRAEVAPAR